MFEFGYIQRSEQIINLSNFLSLRNLSSNLAIIEKDFLQIKNINLF